MTDDLNRKVTLPQTVNRVVSLAPNLTEVIYAVNGGDRLVGNTTYCNFPAQANDVQKVGDTISPNLEAIIALKPDVVLVSTASQIETFAKKLEEQNIPVFITGPKDLNGVYKSINDIGEILGKNDRAAELVASLKNRVANVEAGAEQNTPYRIFVQIYEEPLFTAGKSSFITDLIERAGAFSVTADLNDDYPKLSKETALALKPDIIILASMIGGEPQTVNAVFAQSPAVQNKKVFTIDGDLLTRPGPRLVDGLEQIAEKIRRNEN